MLTPEDWHRRFIQQAGWTRELRQSLASELGLAQASHILEAGCGTGAITADLHHLTSAAIFGIDLDLARLKLAKQIDNLTHFSAADGLALPFPDHFFDFTLCHYFLLWVQRPAQALAELARVTRPGGYLLALAEPDYGARIDYPEPLQRLGRLQTRSLIEQGANPTLGRQLTALLVDTGLKNVRGGLLGGHWGFPRSAEELESEWSVLVDDLQGMVPSEELHSLREIDQQAWQRGDRILFVPTFYACGQVP